MTRILQIGSDFPLMGIRLDPPEPRHPRPDQAMLDLQFARKGSHIKCPIF
jgi:hypothetical protein